MAVRLSIGDLSLAACLILTVQVTAHDMTGAAENTFLDVVAPAQQTTQDASTTFVVRSVIDQYKLWEAGQSISVCFFGGEPAMRGFFVETSKVWDAPASISFDFGPAPNFRDCSGSSPSHIRVAFVPGSSWSYVGTDSTTHSLDEPSLNIDAPASLAVANRRKLGGIILHELGHALAMKHEHQNPESHCEGQLNWPVVTAALSAPPNSWDQPTIDRNMREFTTSQRLRNSEYDPKSIMHYSLPAEWFINGANSPCWVKRNDGVSALDLAAVSESYPESPALQDQYLSSFDKVTAEVIGGMGLSPDEITLIQSEINAALGAVAERSIQTNFMFSLGACSPPINNNSGSITFNCPPGRAQKP